VWSRSGQCACGLWIEDVMRRNLWQTGAGAILAAGLALAWLPGPVFPLLFCLACAAFSLAWLVQSWRQRRRPKTGAALGWLAALALWIGAHRLLVRPPDAIAAGVEFAVWTAAPLLALVLANELDSRRALDGWLRAAGAAAAAIAGWALFQGLTSGGRVFWLAAPAAPVERVWGPFLYHNKLAQFAQLMLPVLMCLAAKDGRRRWWWLAAAAGLPVVTVAAASRAGTVLLAAECLLCCFLLAVRGLSSRRGAALLAMRLAAAAGAGVLIAGWEPLAERIDPQQMLSDRRFDLYASSWEMARAHLPWGAGYGGWAAVYPEFARFDDGRYANQAHNDWLQWLCEGGIPGLALMLAFAMAIARPLLRGVWGCGVLFVFAHALVDYPFRQSAPLAVLVVCIAVVAHRDNGRWLEGSGGGQYAPSPVSTTFTVLPRM